MFDIGPRYLMGDNCTVSDRSCPAHFNLAINELSIDLVRFIFSSENG